MAFHIVLGRIPVSKIKFWKTVVGAIQVSFFVSTGFAVALNMSVMGEMSLQSFFYLCQNNAQDKFSSQCIWRRRQWELSFCQCYFKKSKPNVTSYFQKIWFRLIPKKEQEWFFTMNSVSSTELLLKRVVQMSQALCKIKFTKVTKSYNLVNCVFMRSKFTV